MNTPLLLLINSIATKRQYRQLSISDNNFFDEATSIKVLEDVVYTGSLGSRVTRLFVENKLNIPFEWVGVKGESVKSAGGSEEYLRSRELGFNYIEDLFKN